LNEEMWPSIMTTRLGGIIFRKALIENNWSKVYENLVFSMMEEEIESETDLLKTFGDIGG
jgi:hypothetical protein